MHKYYLLVLCFATIIKANLFAQPVQIDKIVAIVGDKPILLSEVETQTAQFASQTNVAPEELRCNVLEELIVAKLLLNQAEKDSVDVNDAQVDMELNKKIRYFVSQIGSIEKLEAYLGKSILQIKEDFRDRIKDQLIAQQMQAKIAGEVKVSPKEVREYFERIPADSLPFIESEMQVAQILKKPPVNESEKDRVRKELGDIRKKILDGRSFASMAAFYSEDIASASKGGELGYVNRGDLVPEFEAAAFTLKGKEISDVIESVYGFHIIQLIDRRGESINVRHVLMSPKPSSTDLEKARLTLDSIAEAIRNNTLTFEEAALKYSDDIDTKNNEGLLINPNSGSTWFEVSQMDQSLFFVVDKLKPGEVSDPSLVRMGEKKEAYRLLMVKNRTEPHIANLKDDYQKIQSAAEMEKRDKLLRDWIDSKKSSFFIKITEEFKSCIFETSWVQNQ